MDVVVNKIECLLNSVWDTTSDAKRNYNTRKNSFSAQCLIIVEWQWMILSSCSIYSSNTCLYIICKIYIRWYFVFGDNNCIVVVLVSWYSIGCNDAILYSLINYVFVCYFLIGLIYCHSIIIKYYCLYVVWGTSTSSQTSRKNCTCYKKQDIQYDTFIYLNSM